MHPIDRERREREVEEFVAANYGDSEKFAVFIEEDPDIIKPLWDAIYLTIFGNDTGSSIIREARILAEKFKDHLEEIEQWEVRK